MNVRMMKLSDINIPEPFLAHPPKREKVEARIRQAKKKPLRVAVNGYGWLTDLYASYIAAKELGLDMIGAIPGKDFCQAVSASFPGCDKEYTWLIPDGVLADWEKRGVERRPGLKLAVPSPFGPRQARAVEFFEVPFPSEHKEIIGLWSMSKNRPEQHAEHVRLANAIADYCAARGIPDLEGFLEKAADDPDARHLYQFAAGKWAVKARLDGIRTAIGERWTSHDA